MVTATSLASRHRDSSFKGVPECAAWGLHSYIYGLFEKAVPRGASVLDLGSGCGAWALRLQDAGYQVTGCDVNIAQEGVADLPFQAADLNAEFSRSFNGRTYDAVTFVEVIEHLENPRLCFREIAKLVKVGGTVVVSTPNASGLYSRLRFFLTGQFCMFTDKAYGAPVGHITPLTAWQLEKVFQENGFTVAKRSFHDAPFFPPRSLGDLAKLFAWTFVRPFQLGTVGGQSIIYVLRKEFDVKHRCPHCSRPISGEQFQNLSSGPRGTANLSCEGCGKHFCLSTERSK